ncbi:MAG: hypothetical protein JWN23_1321 [Rhodocyclales bacterium]|nr:hypothetical protein [Rhodocyclales bacterium]
MVEWLSVAPSALTSFMASMVEFVEALTIVLAVGIVRGWRSALLGTGAAAILLTALVLVLGRSLANVSLPALQLVVGVLLLMFGLRWLRKAILRAAGVLPLHDESKTFAEETAALRRQDTTHHAAIDPIAFLTAFKAVMLEGIEVVFIVIALGSGGRLLVPAAIGAGVALAVVVLLGLMLHRPLATVPENTLKFGVGVMLSAFGSFWVGEGVGIEWVLGDWTILLLIATFLFAALGLVRACRGVKRPVYVAGHGTSKNPPSVLAGVFAELFGLFVDDGWLAAGILGWVLAAWFLRHQYAPAANAASFVFAIGLLIVLGMSAIRKARG